MESQIFSSEPILSWLEESFIKKVSELKENQKKILTDKEVEFQHEVEIKSSVYRTEKFDLLQLESKKNVNYLIQKFRFNRDLLIEKTIDIVIRSAIDKLFLLINSEPSILIYYYSNLINFISKNFPQIKNIYCPALTGKYFSQFKIENNKLNLLTNESLKIGIIGEIEENKKLIFISPEILYDNNRNDIRKLITKLLIN
jgi:hypothetical protein